MLEEHTNLGWWVRILRPWRRTLIVTAAPPPPTGVAPIPVIGVSPATIVQGAQVTFSRAGTTVQNVGTMVWRITHPDTTTEDLGPFPIDATADIAYQPLAVGTFSVTALMVDTVNGLTAQATMTFTVTASGLAVGSVQLLPLSGAGLVGGTIPMNVTVRSVGIGGTLAAKRAALLSYIQGLPVGTSKRVLSGQNWATFNDAEQAVGSGGDRFAQIKDIFTQTGEFPAIMGIPCDWFGATDMASTMLAAGAAGYLVSSLSLFKNPATGGPPGDTNITFHDLLVAGPTRTAWFAALDAVAAILVQMRDAGYNVLFRPFDELNGTWFWHNTPFKASAADFIAVWQEMYTYLMTTKGLADCLLWNFNVYAGMGNYVAAYPGSSYVDVVSFDYYGDTPASGCLATYNALVALSPAKPIFVEEFGAHTSTVATIQTQEFTYDNSQLIRDIASSMPKCFGFMMWDANWAISRQNGAIALMGHPWTVNRDDFINRPSGTSQVLTGRAVANNADAPAIASVTPTGQSPLATLKAVGRSNIQSACEGIFSNVSPIDVSLPAPPQGGLYPNLPVGLLPLFEYNGNGLPGGGTLGLKATGMVSGMASFFNYFGGAGTVGSDSSAIDPSQVLDVKYPTTLRPGDASVGFWMWKNGLFTPVTEYYEAGWVRILGADFLTPGTGEWKFLGYWAVGQPPGGSVDNQIYNVLAGAGGSAVSSFSFYIREQNIQSWTIPGGTIVCGRHYRYEIYMKLENPQGAPNGLLKVWLTDLDSGGSPVLVIDNNTRAYRPVPPAPPAANVNSAGFWKRTAVMVWGGGGGPNKTRDDHVQFAKLAAFGR